MCTLLHALAVRVPFAIALAVFIFLSPTLTAEPRLTTLYTFSGVDGNNPCDLVIGPHGVLYGTTLYGGTGSTCNAGAGCGTVFSLTPPASPAAPWTQSVIHDFTGIPGDGEYPQSIVIGNDGVIYGITSSGGTIGYGTVFSLTPPAAPGSPWTETVLYNFGGGSDAATPFARLLIGSGPAEYPVLYGATCCGGTYGQGAVYSLTPPASAGGPWIEAVLFSFTIGGFNATPSLTIDDHGVLYGATFAGGTGTACWDGCGTVFSLAPSGPNGAWEETVLHNFTGGSGEGEGPTFLMGRLGVIYGVTLAGGTSDQGTVFSLTPPASPDESWTQTVLFNYPQFDGGHWNLGPGPLVLSPESGVFYGVTAYGGDSGGGAAFSLTPPASPVGSWSYSLLAAFDQGDYGAFPTTLIGSGHLLYGTTAAGPASNLGTVFSLEP